MAKTAAQTQSKCNNRKSKSEHTATLAIDVPVIDPGDGYRPEQLQVGYLTRQQREGLKWLVRGLDAAGAQTTSAHLKLRPVANGADAVRWVLDEIGKRVMA